MLQIDRMHPNAAGARTIADHIWPHLQRLLAGVG
jgi:lysophospholipase L1-like esterase